jgi:hypothetical protein
MPVQADLISTAIISQFSTVDFRGKNDKDIADSIGAAIANYLIIPNLVTCTLNGIMGPVGSISSITVIGLVAPLMSSLMLQQASSLSFTGTRIISYFYSISSGICQVLQGMVLSGNAVGIATGVGTGKFTAINAQALSKLILAQMIFKNMTGKNNKDLADIVAFGIVNHLQSSVTFSVITTGVVAPVSPTGPVAVFSIPSLFTKIS